MPSRSYRVKYKLNNTTSTATVNAESAQHAADLVRAKYPGCIIISVD